jgi:hypothetical protein
MRRLLETSRLECQREIRERRQQRAAGQEGQERTTVWHAA